MTKQDLWAAYVAKTPSFIGEKPITMSGAGLRKLFEQTWEKAHEAGHKEGRDVQRAIEGLRPKGGPDVYSKSPYDIFGDIFKTKSK